MTQKTEKKFELGEMVLGFFVGLFIDIIAAILDILSAGVGGALVQGTVWPFLKKYWISSKNKKQEDILKDYVLPMIGQAIVPVLPTLCLTIPVYMYLENKVGKSAIIKTESKLLKPKEISKETREKMDKLEKPTPGTPLSNNSKPRILSMPSSPIRTQNNPIIQEYKKENEEQETPRKAA